MVPWLCVIWVSLSESPTRIIVRWVEGGLTDPNLLHGALVVGHLSVVIRVIDSGGWKGGGGRTPSFFMVRWLWVILAGLRAGSESMCFLE